MVICYCGVEYIRLYPLWEHFHTKHRMGGFLSFARFSSCLFGHYSFLSDLHPTTHPTLFPLFTFPSRNPFKQTSLFFILWHGFLVSLAVWECFLCSQSSLFFTPSLCKHGQLLRSGCLQYCFTALPGKVRWWMCSRLGGWFGVLVIKRDVKLTCVFCFRWQARPGGGLGGLPASRVSRAPEGL